MDNPQLAKANPQLSLHPALIPPYCNPAFVPPEEKKKKRGVLVSKRDGEQRGIEAGRKGGAKENERERGAEIEEYEWEQIG